MSPMARASGDGPFSARGLCAESCMSFPIESFSEELLKVGAPELACASVA